MNASNHDLKKWTELSKQARALHRRLEEFRNYDFSTGGLAWEQAEADDPNWGDYL